MSKRSVTGVRFDMSRLADGVQSSRLSWVAGRFSGERIARPAPPTSPPQRGAEPASERILVGDACTVSDADVRGPGFGRTSSGPARVLDALDGCAETDPAQGWPDDESAAA